MVQKPHRAIAGGADPEDISCGAFLVQYSPPPPGYNGRMVGYVLYVRHAVVEVQVLVHPVDPRIPVLFMDFGRRRALVLSAAAVGRTLSRVVCPEVLDVGETHLVDRPGEGILQSTTREQSPQDEWIVAWCRNPRPFVRKVEGAVHGPLEVGYALRVYDAVYVYPPSKVTVVHGNDVKPFTDFNALELDVHSASRRCYQPVFAFAVLEFMVDEKVELYLGALFRVPPGEQDEIPFL